MFYSPFVSTSPPVIGTPTGLGNRGITVGTGITSMTLTTTGNIIQGDLAVVAFATADNLLVQASSITDGTNTYTLAVRTNDGSVVTEEIWYCANAVAVASGATVTVHFNATTSSSTQLSVALVRVSGIIPSSPLDKTASQATVTQFPSVASGTLSQANEVIIGVNCTGTGTVTSTNFNNIYLNINSGSGFAIMSVCYFITTGTGSINFNLNDTSSHGNATSVATFKGF